MFSAIRRRMRVSPATVVAGLALVFAMTGGAYAAKKYLITSTSQIKPSVLAQLKGKAGANGATGAQGAQGVQGPAGPAGPKGETGASGSNGTNGTNGKSVLSGLESPGVNCAEGGARFEVEGSGVKHYACNGKTGFAEALPSEKSERGVWSAIFTATAGGQVITSAISFPIPLESAPHVEEAATFIGPKEGEGEENENKVAIPSHCKGTVENPEAVPGNLCVFTRFFKNVKRPGLGVAGSVFLDPRAGSVDAAGPEGVVLTLASEEEGLVLADGVWVVAAE